MTKKKKLCSCGFPQSFPIKHQHDRNDNISAKDYDNRNKLLILSISNQIIWIIKKELNNKKYQCVESQSAMRNIINEINKLK